MKKLTAKLTNFYYNLRLQTKFTVTHLVIATIPMIVLGIFFYAKLYDMIVSDTIRTEQAASAHTAPLVEDTVQRVLDTFDTFSDFSFYQDIFHQNTNPSLDDMPTSSAAADFQNQTADLIDEKLITDIRVYLDLPETQSLFSSPNTSDIMLPLREAKGTYWYGIFEGSGTTSTLYCPSFYLSPYEVQHYGDLAYISKDSFYYDGEMRTCYTVIYYSKTPFVNLLKDNLTSTGSVAYIINDRDSLIAASDHALVGNYPFDYDSVQDFFMSSNNFILKNVLGENVYAGFYNIDAPKWYMVVAMPSTPMITKSISIVAGFLLVYLACIIFAVLIGLYLSRSITNRISSVINQMAMIRTSPPVALPASDSRDEIGDLIDTYNYMIHIMNQLTLEQAKASEDLRISEFNSLQAQINPHFLYNTMDMINWLAQQGRSQEVTQAIQNLSKFYKLTLSRKKSISTIADEIEHVSIYVRLQNMRYANHLDFVIDIPDNLMEYHIPNLTFQPVIENAILHGILEKDSKEGTLVLTGWLQDDMVVILISDDGVGIAPDKLPTILSGDGNSRRGSNIAIYNTHRRIQLLYGTDYGLFYTSTPGEGTEVEIRLPAE